MAEKTEEKPMKISQSLMKSLMDYVNDKECGFVFKAKYIDNRYDLFPATDAQNLGSWFEYMATGSVLKGGKVPQPMYLKKKDKQGRKILTKPYELMLAHVNNFKNMMAVNGLEIIRAGEDIYVPYPESKERFGINVLLTGVLDIRALAKKDIYTITGSKLNGFEKVLVAEKGQQVILDMKSTNLINDKYNEYGWENLNEKTKLTTQPVHYKYIEYLKTGQDVPFIFMLFSSSNKFEASMIDFKVSESEFTFHQQFIDNTIVQLKEVQEQGFEPLPSMEKCSVCPLRSDCKYRALTPQIKVFYFNR